MKDRLHFVFAALALTGLGLASGWFAASGGSTAHEAPAAEPDPGGHADEIHLSAAARANLGVVTAPLEATDFVRPRRITAIVEETPLAMRALFASVGGRVVTLGPDPGETVESGGMVVELLREPIAPPKLEVCREALTPNHGEIHAAIRNLREGLAAYRIASDELERLSEFTGPDSPVVPRERIVELEYQLRRSRTLVESVTHELARHGFSEQGIAELAEGHTVPALFGESQQGGHSPADHSDQVAVFDADVVMRALEHAGIWNARAEELWKALPAMWHDQPIAVATVGELVALRRAPDGLATWLTSSPEAGERFLEVASLLLQGVTLTDVRQLVADGMLDERIAVRAPTGPGGYRVLDYHVRPGATVVAGAELATLHDPRAVRLRVTPVGSEIAAVLDAVQRGIRCTAEPLIPDTGPRLDDVVLTHSIGAEGTMPTAAFADLVNEPLAGSADGTPRYRTWLLRPGTRYELQIPSESLEDVYVLPREALIEDGSDRAVLMEHVDDGGLQPIPVRVAWEDHRQVVLRRAEQDPLLTPGTPVVVRGAFEAGLQLQAGDHAMEHDHH